MLPNASHLNASSFHSTRSIGLSITSIVLTFTSTTGNSIVLVLIYQHRRLRTVSNLIVMNVCIADTLFAVLWFPMNAYYWSKATYPGDSLCSFIGVLGLLCSMVSIHTLVFVSIERFLATNFPLQHRGRFTMTCVKYGLAFIWICDIFLTTLPFVVAKYTYLEKFYHCVNDWSENKASSFAYFTISYLLPFLVILFCNIYILRAARRLGGGIHAVHVISASTKNRAKNARIRHERWASFVVGTIISAFIICWTPYTIAALCFQVKNCKLPKEFMAAAVMIAGVNGSCNPVIYGIMNKNFRIAFSSNLACKPRSGINNH
ncbi:probable G-protein coupled receptor No18 [Dendronephthya gigantea]|uniref:probable G-protein coupled receptor No18 n=1 Tax=Dendronephthya gigantea TaxID=151771 RepID=UPI00106C90CF|nr:probable G-protein coupled receptor No18 [Dendronephthya gigantea]